MIQPLLFVMFLMFGVNFVMFALTGSQPAVTAALSAGVVVADTVIPLNTVEGMPSAGLVYIGDEVLSYTGTTSSCPAPYASEPSCLTGVSRGALQTSAKSHSAGSRVYNETAGGVNQLAGFESRTNIDSLGATSSPWGFIPAMIGFLASAVSLQVAMFTGAFGILGLVVTIFNIAAVAGLGYMLAALIRGS